MNIIKPDEPRRCTYNNDKKAPNPHEEYSPKSAEKILPDILHTVGNSPMVKLNRIPQSFGIKCEMLAKCEFKNPGGSIKDRIALSIIENAERRGLLKPGYTVIEPTSGNTGIGLAMVCAVKGYKCVCVLPYKTSIEKEDILQSLGAKAVRTPDVPYDHPDGVFCVAENLLHTTPNSIIARQFNNPSNPMAHYCGTAMEIYDQCDGQVDMVVGGVGSGGTLTGVGRKIKELLPNCLIVGVDPVGSTIAEPASLNETHVKHFEMEGMGHNWEPSVLDKTVVDFWIKVDDKSAFEMARRLHREEGILCGASAGGLMSGALEAAKRLKKGQRCVVMIPDGIGNYLTKFVSDYWMESKNCLKYENVFDHWWWNRQLSDCKLKLQTTAVSPSTTFKEVSKLFENEKLDVLPCVNGDGELQGILYAKDLVRQMLKNGMTLNDTIQKVLSQEYRTVTMHSSLAELSHILQREPVAVVVDRNDEAPSTLKLMGLLGPADLLKCITDNDVNH